MKVVRHGDDDEMTVVVQDYEKKNNFVTPAKAGVQSLNKHKHDRALDSRLRGNDGGGCGNDESGMRG